MPFRSTAAILNAILDLRSRGSRENSSKICVTFPYSLPIEYYSHRFTFTAVTSRAFCCLDRLRAINLSTFVSNSNSNSVAVSQTSKLTPRTLAPSQANANRAECVNSALKEGYPLPLPAAARKNRIRRSTLPILGQLSPVVSVFLSVCPPVPVRRSICLGVIESKYLLDNRLIDLWLQPDGLADLLTVRD